MKSVFATVIFLALGIGLLQAQGPQSVDPAGAKVGQQVTLRGNGLGPQKVKAVYISDEEKDYKVSIIQQGDDGITFEVPSVRPGVYGISLMSVSNEKQLLWYPGIKLRVEP